MILWPAVATARKPIGSIGTTQGGAKEFDITVQPGEILTITATFNGRTEHNVEVFDANWNNLGEIKHSGESVIVTNAGLVRTLDFFWWQSAHRMVPSVKIKNVTVNDDYQKVACAVNYDDDYAAAVIEASISR